MARSGKDFSLPERKIEITDVEILAQTDVSISIRLTISSGGYIRSLAPTLGEFFGVNGGYISELRREKLFFENTHLSLDNAHLLDNITINDTLDWNQIFPDAQIIYSDNKALQEKVMNGKEILFSEIMENSVDSDMND